MPVNPRIIADAAKRIVDAGQEIDYRNAASRAYYALYHAALQLMQREVGRVKRYPCGVHQCLINHLEEIAQQGGEGKITAELGADLAGVLAQTKRLRNNADYKLNLRFRESDAQMVISYMYDYLEQIEKLGQDPMGQ